MHNAIHEPGKPRRDCSVCRQMIREAEAVGSALLASGAAPDDILRAVHEPRAATLEDHRDFWFGPTQRWRVRHGADPADVLPGEQTDTP